MNYSLATHCGTLSREQIAERRAAGEAVATIAAAAGVHSSTLYLALHDWGLTGPRGGDRRSQSWRRQLGGAA